MSPMPDDERKVKLRGMGIRGLSPFTAPARRTNAVKSTQAMDSNEATCREEFDKNRERYERDKYIRRGVEREMASEVQRLKDQIVTYNETRAQLKEFKDLFTHMTNAELKAQTECLRKDTTKGSPEVFGQYTPRKNNQMSGQIFSRVALIRGSPVGKSMCDEDPSSYVATGMYESDGKPI
jgi:hypothetical protein